MRVVRFTSGVLAVICLMVAVPLMVVSFGLFSLTDDDVATLPTISASSEGRAIRIGEIDFDPVAAPGGGVTLSIIGDDLFVGTADRSSLDAFLLAGLPPTDVGFWDVSGSGDEATIVVETNQGRWSAVVMNLDGTSGVEADITATIAATPVRIASATVLGAGVLAAAASILLFVVAFRRQPPSVEGPDRHDLVGAAQL